MGEAQLVDEFDLPVVPLHDLHLYALWPALEARRRRRRGLVRIRTARLVGEGDGAVALADLRCGRVRTGSGRWLALDVAVGRGVYGAGSGGDAGVYHARSARFGIDVRPNRLHHIPGAGGSVVAS